MNAAEVKLNNGIAMPTPGYGVFKMDNGQGTVDRITEALAVGYRHIDTAAAYHNEESVGRALGRSGIPRDQVFVTTKCWNDDQRAGAVRQALDRSLQNLGLDVVDLYLIHWPVPGKFTETWKAFEDLYAGGKVRAVGVSNFEVHHLEALSRVSSLVPAVNQIELTPYLTQAAVRNYCGDHGIVVESWSPLGAGRSTLLTDPVVTAIAGRHRKTPAQVILRWNLELGIVPLPKSATPDRVKENFGLFDFSLTAGEVGELSALERNGRLGPHPDSFDF